MASLVIGPPAPPPRTTSIQTNLFKILQNATKSHKNTSNVLNSKLTPVKNLWSFSENGNNLPSEKKKDEPKQQCSVSTIQKTNTTSNSNGVVHRLLNRANKSRRPKSDMYVVTPNSGLQSTMGRSSSRYSTLEVSSIDVSRLNDYIIIII